MEKLVCYMCISRRNRSLVTLEPKHHVNSKNDLIVEGKGGITTAVKTGWSKSDSRSCELQGFLWIIYMLLSKLHYITIHKIHQRLIIEERFQTS